MLALVARAPAPNAFRDVFFRDRLSFRALRPIFGLPPWITRVTIRPGQHGELQDLSGLPETVLHLDIYTTSPDLDSSNLPARFFSIRPVQHTVSVRCSTPFNIEVCWTGRTRWKHELRAYRLGTLEPVELTALDPKNSRLAQIRSGGQITGLFFLAHRGRALFGLTLKGIYLKEFDDFEGMLVPILKSLEEDGPTLMLESET